MSHVQKSRREEPVLRSDALEQLAPLGIRRDEEIFAADGGWFRARWHFSFDEYDDPGNMGIGTLRVFNHDTLVPGAVWPMHPHRDVEGITYVIAGEFEHADSLGGGGVLEPGGVQRMTLGSGAYHSERNHSQTEEMQFLQLWILPDRHGLKPEVAQRQHTVSERYNRWLRIVRPTRSEGTGVTVHQDTSIYATRLDPGVTVEHRIERGRGGYLYVIDGGADVNNERLVTGDAAYITDAGLLRIRARATSELLLVDTPL
jgi:redox-sensitive bicupin YhaK (pirin superfamily)